MTERFTYEVRPHTPIRELIPGRIINKPTTTKLTKEEVLICMKHGPVYRVFPGKSPIRVFGSNIDQLHQESFAESKNSTKVDNSTINAISNARAIDVVSTAPKTEEVTETISSKNTDNKIIVGLEENTEIKTEPPVKEPLFSVNDLKEVSPIFKEKVEEENAKDEVEENENDQETEFNIVEKSSETEEQPKETEEPVVVPEEPETPEEPLIDDSEIEEEVYEADKDEEENNISSYSDSETTETLVSAPNQIKVSPYNKYHNKKKKH